MTKINDFHKGDTIDVVFDTFTNSDDTDKNIALADLIITFKIAKSDLDDVAAFQKRVTIPDNALTQVGEYTLNLTSTDTKSLPTGNIFYDIRLIEDNGGDPDIVSTVVNDNVRVLENISDLGDVVFTPVLSVDTRTITAQQIESLMDAYYGNTDWRS